MGNYIIDTSHRTNKVSLLLLIIKLNLRIIKKDYIRYCGEALDIQKAKKVILIIHYLIDRVIFILNYYFIINTSNYNLLFNFQLWNKEIITKNSEVFEFLYFQLIECNVQKQIIFYLYIHM